MRLTIVAMAARMVVDAMFRRAKELRKGLA
jgi:hypothetical protein